MKWRKQLLKKRRSRKDLAEAEAARRRVYEITWLSKHLKRWQWTAFIPFSPTFDEELFRVKPAKEKKKRRKKQGDAPSIEVTEHDD